jgi:hypothetical protein
MNFTFTWILDKFGFQPKDGKRYFWDEATTAWVSGY